MVIPRTYGRMGNFLFQAAAAAAYAIDYGLEFTVPTTTADAKWNPIYLQQLAHPEFNPNLDSVVIKEKHEFHYVPIPFEARWRQFNIVLDGYWQSEKYFEKHRDAILKLFGFRWSPKPNHISVHVRRGDYLTIRRNGMLKHPAVTQHWIHDQMAKFPGARFIFFSDDLPWCEEAFHNRKDCAFHHGSTEVDDLVGMSWCEHHICSASTFSWWGAWLNQNPQKRVITPKHWLTPGWNNHQHTEEIIPERWERA
jgi:hypothetical protein